MFAIAISQYTYTLVQYYMNLLKNTLKFTKFFISPSFSIVKQQHSP